MDDLIAKSDFSECVAVSIPQLSQWTDVCLNIKTGKADITFAEPSAVYPFLQANPGSLVEYFPENPLRVFPTCLATGIGENKFISRINSALIEMHNDGTIDRIIQKYETSPNDYLRPAQPYSVPTTKPAIKLKKAA